METKVDKFEIVVGEMSDAKYDEIKDYMNTLEDTQVYSGHDGLPDNFLGLGAAERIGDTYKNVSIHSCIIYNIEDNQKEEFQKVVSKLIEIIVLPDIFPIDQY